MSKQLHSAMSNVLKMGYYKNEHARSGDYSPGHEEAVAKVLQDAGFNEVFPVNYNLQRKHLKEWWENDFGDNLITHINEMPSGSFMLQPGGTQSFPDILVRDFDSNKFIALECKSGKGVCPMWNDSIPKKNAIYIFCTGKYNETTVFLGQDLINKETQSLFEQAVTEMNAIAQKYTELAGEHDVFNSGFKVTCRKQFFQYGGADKTDYFKHRNRAIRELNVLEFVS